METKQLQYDDIASPSKQLAAITGTDTQNLPKLIPAQPAQNQWQEISKAITKFGEQFPENLEKFSNAYKQPLIALGWVFLTFVLVKVILAILSAINDIPLAQPLFELIGISYSSWFSFRYLLRTSTREELAAEIDLIKKQFLG
jgi:hypothetical protein